MARVSPRLLRVERTGLRGWTLGIFDELPRVFTQNPAGR